MPVGLIIIIAAVAAAVILSLYHLARSIWDAVRARTSRIAHELGLLVDCPDCPARLTDPMIRREGEAGVEYRICPACGYEQIERRFAWTDFERQLEAERLLQSLSTGPP